MDNFKLKIKKLKFRDTKLVCHRVRFKLSFSPCPQSSKKTNHGALWPPLQWTAHTRRQKNQEQKGWRCRKGKGGKWGGDSGMWRRGSWDLEEVHMGFGMQQAFEQWNGAGQLLVPARETGHKICRSHFLSQGKINNRFINKFYKAVQLFKAFC